MACGAYAHLVTTSCNDPKNEYRPKTTPITGKHMNEPASTPTLAGLWKVFCIIAERTPPNQLIWLALMLCVFSLVLV